MRNWLQPSPSDEPQLALGDEEDKIESPSLISKLLKQTFEQHCLLNITVDDLAVTCGSVIVQLDDDDNCIVLDTLTPADAMATLTAASKLVVSTLLNELPLTFATTVVAVGDDGQEASVHIARPACVYYVQHRGEHRVPVPMNWSISATIVLEPNHCVSAVVRDLSPSGFSARLDAPLPEIPDQFDGPKRFYLTLGTEQIIEGELEICYVGTPEIGNFQRIGARIVTLRPRDQRRIDQCVAAIDRQQSRLT